MRRYWSFTGVRKAKDLVDNIGTAKASFLDAHVVVLGDPGNRDFVMTALAAGATTFVDENVATPTLLKALDLITQGEPVISISILKRLLEHSSAPPEKAVVTSAAHEPEPPDTSSQPAQKLQLSGRETAILKNLVQGDSNKVIANELKIAEATVKVHVKAILRKIRVNNRTQAAIWAMQRQPLPKPGGSYRSDSMRWRSSSVVPGP